MIISCPNCKKRFKINPSLIPTEGRDVQCGSCKNIWFYKVEDQNSTLLTLNEDITYNEVKPSLDNKTVKESIDNKKSKTSLIPIKKEISETKINTNKTNVISNLFSYLVVIFISLVALIILIDTFKTPLINVYPDIEIILFNLFETLKDIKLFIIDLY